NACHGVTNIDVQKFRDKYSYIARNVAPDDVFLSLEARDKACAWLFEQGFYIQGTGIDYDGNCSVLSKLLFDGMILYQNIKAPNYPELHLKEPKQNSEYRAVENLDVASGTNQYSISGYIDV
nr:integrase [Vibrio anguillarum]